MKIRTFFYTIEQGITGVFKNKWFAFATVATISACLFVFGIFYAIAFNVLNIVQNAEQNVESDAGQDLSEDEDQNQVQNENDYSNDQDQENSGGGNSQEDNPSDGQEAF